MQIYEWVETIRKLFIWLSRENLPIRSMFNFISDRWTLISRQSVVIGLFEDDVEPLTSVCTCEWNVNFRTAIVHLVDRQRSINVIDPLLIERDWENMSSLSHWRSAARPFVNCHRYVFECNQMKLMIGPVVFFLLFSMFVRRSLLCARDVSRY
jgi:hypothetical protein